MPHVVRAPQEHTHDGLALFLAGGISNCPDWQHDLIDLLADLPATLLDPRRDDFDVSDPTLTEHQIAWEHRHLQRADAVSFWFPSETLCPITLFELGKMAALDKPLAVGTHPDYARKTDVIVQLRLFRPDVTVVHTLPDLATAIQALIRP